MLVCASARANMAAPGMSGGEPTGGPVASKPTPLVVDHERLSFRCEEVERSARCSFEAAYRVRNPTGAREEVTGAFYGVSVADVRVTVDGAEALGDLPVELRRDLDRAVDRLDDITRPLPGGRANRSSAGFVIAVDPGASRDLVATGTMSPVSAYWGGSEEFTISGLLARHPVLSTKERSDTEYEFAYLLSPIRTWSGTPTIDVTIRYPSSWTLATESGPAMVSWTHGSESGTAVDSARLDASTAAHLAMHFGVPGTRLLNGGPFLGIGPRFSERGPRLRLGYEIGGPSWLAYALAGETNFEKDVTVIPSVEAMTPDIAVLIPSLAFGIGMPVQAKSGSPTLVGVRAQLALSFPFLSLVFPFDWYPASPSGGLHTAMLAQVSF
jgi:hypothetical protein